MPEARPAASRVSGDREEAIVAWLQRRGVTVGDDTGEIPLRRLRGRLAITTDSQIEGVHYPGELDPWLVAQRLVRVNLSDLAAAAATPAWLTCNLNAPLERFDWRRFFGGLLHECEQYSVQLVGGDCAAAPTPVLSLTAIGVVPEERTTPRRDQGRPKDRIWVSGTLGEAALGLELQRRGATLSRRGVRLSGEPELPRRLRSAARRAVVRHRLPEPALAIGTELGRLARRFAGERKTGGGVSCIDLSDGLLKDLARLCSASHAGARIDLARLPLSNDSEPLAEALDRDIWKLSLGGGEDYVLLFTLPSKTRPPAGCHLIGELVEGEGIALERDGRRIDHEWAADLGTGWDHLD